MCCGLHPLRLRLANQPLRQHRDALFLHHRLGSLPVLRALFWLGFLFGRLVRIFYHRPRR
jgi:hypothetical protein